MYNIYKTRSPTAILPLYRWYLNTTCVVPKCRIYRRKMTITCLYQTSPHCCWRNSTGQAPTRRKLSALLSYSRLKAADYRTQNAGTAEAPAPPELRLPSASSLTLFCGYAESLLLFYIYRSCHTPHSTFNTIALATVLPFIECSYQYN